jgi:predicted HTH transcriptional regulator
MYPEEAVRELVANALFHQDIEDRSSFAMVKFTQTAWK